LTIPSLYCFQRAEYPAGFPLSHPGFPFQSGTREYPATTGLWEGEIYALRWADLDFDKNQISIRYTYQRVNKEWILKNTKTDGSSRMVIIPKIVSDILKKQKLQQKEWQLFYGPDYVFSGFINTWPQAGL